VLDENTHTAADPTPRSRGRRRRAPSLLLGVVGIAAFGLAVSVGNARAEIFANTYRSADYGVEITVPRGFELSEQRGYPGLLARAIEHTSGARLSLAAQRLAPGESARATVERNVGSLKKLGYRINGTTTGALGAAIVDAVSPDGKRALRQAYVAQDGFVYILTLAVAPESMRYYGRAFDETLHSMTVAAPVEPAPPLAPASAPAPPASAPASAPAPPASAPASQPAPHAETTP
jgi:hypothetical protein